MTLKQTKTEDKLFAGCFLSSFLGMIIGGIIGYMSLKNAGTSKDGLFSSFGFFLGIIFGGYAAGTASIVISYFKSKEEQEEEKF